MTHQKIEYMKDLHVEKMKWAGKFLTEVTESVDGLLADVTGDIEMSGCLETALPSPPSLSHLFLKHCEGREIAEDALTPRIDKGKDKRFAAVPTGQSAAESMESGSEDGGDMGMTMTGMTTMKTSFADTMGPNATGISGSVHFGVREYKKRIERNKARPRGGRVPIDARKAVILRAHKKTQF